MSDPDIKKLREEHIEKLRSIKPVMTVKSLNQARSNEVIDYVMQRLQDGVRYDMIRREIGLGDHNGQRMWAEIKKIVSEYLVPTSAEDALLASHQSMSFWLKKYEDFVCSLDQEIEACPRPQLMNTPDGPKMIDTTALGTLMRVKSEALDKLIKHKNQLFQDFMKIKTLEAKERGNQGTSILIVNNIPRPETRVKDVQTDLTAQVKAVRGTKNQLEQGKRNKDRE